MAVPASISDLSVTGSSNSPQGADTATTSTAPDDYIRAHAAILRRLQAQATATASAATVDLGAIATGSYIHITGNTTITSFGTVDAGISRVLVFDGIITLTHNAISLILPSGANITTAAGDVAEFVSEGYGNWRCTSYVKASGDPVVVGSYQPLDDLLTALAAQTTAANNVQAYSGADAPTLLTTGISSGNIPLVGTKSATEALAGLVELATQAEAEAGTDDTVVMTPLKTAQAISASQVDFFESPELTITNGTGTSAAHGLGAVPKNFQAFLRCKTAEYGYSVGDEVRAPSLDGHSGVGAYGCIVSSSSANLYVGAYSNGIRVLNKSTWAEAIITNANWRYVLRAWSN